DEPQSSCVRQRISPSCRRWCGKPNRATARQPVKLRAMTRSFFCQATCNATFRRRADDAPAGFSREISAQWHLIHSVHTRSSGAFAALGIGFQRDGGNVTADIANANDVGELGSAARWHDL